MFAHRVDECLGLGGGVKICVDLQQPLLVHGGFQEFPIQFDAGEKPLCERPERTLDCGARLADKLVPHIGSRGDGCGVENINDQVLEPL